MMINRKNNLFIIIKKMKKYLKHYLFIIIIIQITMNTSNEITQLTIKYLPLIKLRKNEKKYIDDEWHHACLTALNLHPSDDNRYNDIEYTFEEIQNIIKKYGKYPDKNHYYWEELKLYQN